MFIQTESTPNPETLKFLPGRMLLQDGQGRDFQTVEQAAASPLVMRLFSVEGVWRVFLGKDFVSVTKSKGDWSHLKPILLGVFMDFFLSGDPVLAADAPSCASSAKEEFFDPEDAETVLLIQQILKEHVRPAVEADGGDIVFRGFRDGILFLEMRGACSGCPSSTATLRYGIQNLMTHWVPAVREVRPMSGDSC